jgi:4-amino-4-deoxy-L-arabinose transferase-like glycosyltransferase
MISKKTLLNLLPLFLIILLASALRLWAVGKIPISISDDELREVFTSYSLAHTGRDIFGNFLPAVFKIAGYNTWGQTTIYLQSLYFLFFGLTPATARFPFGVISIASLFFFYLIIKGLLNKEIALFSSFALAISIWNIQISRLALDSNVAQFMYLVGIFLFLRSKKTAALIISMLFFFLAFYSYGATKVIFLPLIAVLVWYKFKDLTKRQLVIIVTAVLFIFGSYGYLNITQGAANYSGNPFFFQDKAATSLSVELERRASNAPNIVKTIYLNKYTYWTKLFSINYLEAFSPQYLFLGAEKDGRFAIWERGELYLLDIPFLILGILLLFTKKRKECLLIFMFLLISPLPSGVAVGTSTWVSRAAFMPFWLAAFIGYGIYSVVNLPKKRLYKYAVLVAILLFYTYSLFGYLTQYYYDWSRTNAKYFSKSTQDLVYFVDRYKNSGKKVIISDADYTTFLFFAFYNKMDIGFVQSEINNNPIKFGNVTLIGNCLVNPSENPEKIIPANTVYIATVAHCNYKTKPSAEIRSYDNAETIWNIYEK